MMRNNTTLVVAVVVMVAAAGSLAAPQGHEGRAIGGSTRTSGNFGAGGCRYWCQTPRDGQYYCCDNEPHPPPTISPPGVKPGSCPPVRPQCPPVRGAFIPPNQCSSDSSCFGREKCCFDTCLGHHTCKPPNYGIF